MNATRPRWTRRLLDWLHDGVWQAHPRDPMPGDDDLAPAGVTPLPMVRLEFAACLDDITTRQAAILGVRLQHANSLRDLWHLRTDVFDAVSQSLGQREATARLARLNRHFPTRAPRSAFGIFDAAPAGRNENIKEN